jgi:hypothetical protein
MIGGFFFFAFLDCEHFGRTSNWVAVGHGMVSTSGTLRIVIARPAKPSTGFCLMPTALAIIAS